MPDYEVGQIRGRYLAGVLVDRGRVVSIRRTAAHGFCHAQVLWECGDQSYEEERVLHIVTGTITYDDLAAAGIAPVQFGCGTRARRTDWAWSIRDDHRALLRHRLEAQGFDVDEEITAVEMPGGDSICLRQEFPAG